MIEKPRLKNIVIFTKMVLSFVLSRKIINVDATTKHSEIINSAIESFSKNYYETRQQAMMADEEEHLNFISMPKSINLTYQKNL